MAQSVEHVIGNDEVISSILISSSKSSGRLGRRIFFTDILHKIANGGIGFSYKRENFEKNKKIYHFYSKICYNYANR